MTAGSRWTCSGVPPAITLPKFSTTTCSARPMTSGMSCSISSTLMLSAAMLRISADSSRFSVGLVPAAGSSSSSSLGCGPQRAGDLEPALLAVGQRRLPGSLARRLEPDPVEQRVRGRGALAVVAPPVRQAEHVADRPGVLQRLDRRPGRSPAPTAPGTAGCSGTCARCRGGRSCAACARGSTPRRRRRGR